MESRGEDRKEFEEIHESGAASLFDLHRAYWHGKFERGGRSVIQCAPPGLDESDAAPRDFVARWVGWGSHGIPVGVRSKRSGAEQWLAMAQISEREFSRLPDWWLKAFRTFSISRSDLDKWLALARASGDSDRVRRRVEDLLHAAARIARKQPKKSLREIAIELVQLDRAEGYSEPSVRKILSGIYPPQTDRKIPDLGTWMRQRE